VSPAPSNVPVTSMVSVIVRVSAADATWAVAMAATAASPATPATRARVIRLCDRFPTRELLSLRARPVDPRADGE
jgi:hypothetical protein